MSCWRAVRVWENDMARWLERLARAIGRVFFNKAALVSGAGVALTGVWGGALAQMMMLPGQFDVSPDGAAVYTVPIEVPSGTAGMSPVLTLDYNGNSGNGLLGVGWNLGGLPSIGRCPQTIAQDGVKGRIDFASTDRFCLDGQRLVVVSGAYGAANSEYRTEIESFTKVVAYGSAGNGPAYFRAWTKSGQIIEFGNTTDSRILAQGKTTARSWAANKISDTAGNYLTIQYTNDTVNGQAYPVRIDYTGNAAAGVAPYNSVRFEYEARPDIIQQFVDGSKVSNTVRLKKIKTYAGAATVVRIYELDYGVSASTDRSKVTSMKTCNGAGTSCLPATSFGYTSPVFGFPQKAESPISIIDMNDTRDLHLGDWNGDGLTDVMTHNLISGLNKWFINDGALSFTTYEDVIPRPQVTGGELHQGDWNGDGVLDVMWWNASSGANKWYTNNNTTSPGFTLTESAILPAQLAAGGGDLFIGDWNGDGISDVMRHDVGTGENKWFVNDGSLNFTQITNPVASADLANAVLLAGDWNHDGIVDLMAWRPATGDNKWFVNDGSLGFTATTNPISTADLTVSSGSANLYPGDWNGDGITDLLFFNSTWGDNNWFVNDGDLGFTVTNDALTPSVLQTSAVHIRDWNQDGVDDVMFFWVSGGTNRWFINSGDLTFDYYSDPIPPTEIFAVFGTLAFGDWNGDGFPDLLSWLEPRSGTPAWWNRWYYNNNLTKPDLLSAATTGLGAATRFFYAPLTDDSIYSKDSGAVYPIVDVQFPHYVVTRVDSENGLGDDYSSSYSYSGAKLDLSGRGFLGFKKQDATDLQTSVVQSLYFHQEYPFIGFVNKDVKTRLGVTLNERTNTYAATNFGGSRRFPYISQVTEASNDLDNSPFPTVTTTYGYDAWGNATQIVVSTPDGSSQTTTNTYSNTTSPWLIGRLLRSEVTSVVPDVTPAPTGCQSNCIGDIAVLSIDDVSVTEGGALVFTVTRTGADALSFSVDYATTDDTAVAGSDYVAKTGTVTFGPQETSKTISIDTIQDALFELDDTVHVNLSNPIGGATIASAQGVGTIINDDAAPIFSIAANASATEGDVISLAVTKSGATALSHTVFYTMADGTATATIDYYYLASNLLTFGPGETTKFATVTTNDDMIEEPDETVLVSLLSVTNGGVLGASQGVGLILDNDAAPACSGGTIINGVCYRASALNETCTQACASYGGCNLALTRAVGSGASSNSLCFSTAGALLGGIDNFNTFNISTPSGCEFGVLDGDLWVAWFNTSTPTTCGADSHFLNKQRVCACNADN